MTAYTSKDGERYDVLSRHVTSEGVLIYLRSPDGQLQARLHRWNGGDAVIAPHSDRTPASNREPAPCA